VRVLIRSHTTRVELGVHDEPTFLPLELVKQSFGSSINTRGIDLVVTVLLEDIDDGSNVFDGVDAGSFGALIWG
jgi:hypothetical protein